MKNTELRKKLIGSAKMLVNAGLNSSTWGNLSVRGLREGSFLVTPSGMDYDLVTPEDIVEVSLDGEVLDGRRKPSSETPMHALFYRERPQINAVVHTHSTYATTMAVLKWEIPPVISELAHGVGGSVPVADYAAAGTEHLGKGALQAMGPKLAVLLQNHGMVALGCYLEDAVRLAFIVENAARIYYLARVAGEPTIVPEQALEEMCRGFYCSYGQK